MPFRVLGAAREAQGRLAEAAQAMRAEISTGQSQLDDASRDWQGECFVFDQRVAVKHGLEQGSYDQCYACRMPLSAADLASEHYVKGLSCPHCHDKTTDEQKAAFAERQKQVQLAKARGEKHIRDGKFES